MRKTTVAIAATLLATLAAPAAADSRITKAAYAHWDAAVVKVYVDQSAKGSGWSLARSIRNWSAGPVKLKVVGNPNAASITVTEIAHHKDYWGNAQHTTVGGELIACDITLTDTTRADRRAHVAAHELGHCLGLPHISEYHSVMDVWYRGDHRGPSSLDLDWLHTAYADDLGDVTVRR